MSEQEQQQSVADQKQPDEQATPASEDNSARESQDDELEKLLAEYEEQPKQEEAKQPQSDSQEPSSSQLKPEAEQPQTAEDIEAVKRRLDEQERREAERQFRVDMDETVKTVRGDLDPGFFTDKFVESWIDAEARDDPRLQRAWQTRREDPKRFERVRQELAKRLHDHASKLPDRQPTEDYAAVADAVRRESNKAPEQKEPNYSTLSNAEFRDKVQKEHGFIPEV